MTARQPSGPLPVHLERVKRFLRSNPDINIRIGDEIKHLFDVVERYQEEVSCLRQTIREKQSLIQMAADDLQEATNLIMSITQDYEALVHRSRFLYERHLEMQQELERNHEPCEIYQNYLLRQIRNLSTRPREDLFVALAQIREDNNNHE